MQSLSCFCLILNVSHEVKNIRPRSCRTAHPASNPLSFDTLRHLTLSFLEHLLRLRWALHDPYLGLCKSDGILCHLTELERLDNTLSYYHKLDYHLWSFGNQWGESDRLLAPSGRPTLFPKLKEVNVFVIAHVSDGEAPLTVGRIDDENHLTKSIQELLFPKQISGLRKLQGVKVSLRTEVKSG